MGGDDPLDRQNELSGHWQKTQAGKEAVPYPDKIEISPDGSYRGQRGPEGSDFTIWDVGEYEIVAPGQVRLSTATDRKITYSYSTESGELTFTDPGGEQIRYRRVR